MGIALTAIGAFLLKLLQIILMIVLCLLLFVLAVVCLVLFCPVCYKGAAEYKGSLWAKGRVSWLFSILSVTFSYQEGKTDSRIRIFGIDILKVLERRQKHGADIEKQEQAKEKRKRRGRRQERQPDLEASEAGTPEEEENVLAEIPDLETSQIQEEREAVQTDLLTGEIQEEEKEQAGRPGIEAFFQRIRELLLLPWKKIKAFFKMLRQIFAKIKSRAEWAGKIWEFWRSESTQGMVCILKDNVLHLLGKIKPRVLRGRIFFGTGDPCTTGQILGAAAILFAAWGKGVKVVPDFEEARFEGELYIKGRISLITLLFIVIRILLSNEWKQFRYSLDQLKEAL